MAVIASVIPLVANVTKSFNLIYIRQANKTDISLLSQLSRSTFTESFAHLNEPEYFQKYLDEKLSPQALASEFEEERNQFFIAEYNLEAAGFCKLVLDEDEQQPALQGKKCLQLERIYILQKFQGLSIGQHLFKKALAIAQEKRFDTVWLGVWEKNDKAIEIYKNWGFETFGSHLFNLGGDMQTDLLMQKNVFPL